MNRPALTAHANPNVAAWMAHAVQHDDSYLRRILADNVVFHSPVVHTPQRGRDITLRYLEAAGSVFADAAFRYVRVIADDKEAMLEFTATMDGIHVNGIDIIRWNDAWLIDDFKVMVRPLKAVHMLWEKMAAQLQGGTELSG